MARANPMHIVIRSLVLFFFKVAMAYWQTGLVSVDILIILLALGIYQFDIIDQLVQISLQFDLHSNQNQNCQWEPAERSGDIGKAKSRR